MQKLVLAAALLAGSVTAASAQTTVVKANIFSPLVHTGSFFAEHQVSEHGSLQLGGQFTAYSQDGDRLRGYAITPEYRFYLSANKPALQGFYVAPFLRYQYRQLTYTDTRQNDQGYSEQYEGHATLHNIGGGIVAGHQWIFRRRFSLDTYLGPSFSNTRVHLEDAGYDLDEHFNFNLLGGFGLRAGVTFGVAF